jgi:hypothetical protein
MFNLLNIEFINITGIKCCKNKTKYSIKQSSKPQTLYLSEEQPISWKNCEYNEMFSKDFRLRENTDIEFLSSYRLQ